MSYAVLYILVSRPTFHNEYLYFFCLGYFHRIVSLHPRNGQTRCTLTIITNSSSSRGCVLILYASLMCATA